MSEDFKKTWKNNKKVMVGEEGAKGLRRLAETFQDGVDVLKCFIDFTSHLCTLKQMQKK